MNLHLTVSPNLYVLMMSFTHRPLTSSYPATPKGPPISNSHVPGTLYFAYGSNLSPLHACMAGNGSSASVDVRTSRMPGTGTATRVITAMKSGAFYTTLASKTRRFSTALSMLIERRGSLFPRVKKRARKVCHERDREVDAAREWKPQ